MYWYLVIFDLLLFHWFTQVANIGPADYNYDESISTLRYANRAKNIQNKARINEDPKDALLRQFQKEIEELRKQLEDGEYTCTCPWVHMYLSLQTLTYSWVYLYFSLNTHVLIPKNTCSYPCSAEIITQSQASSKVWHKSSNYQLSDHQQLTLKCMSTVSNLA